MTENSFLHWPSLRGYYMVEYPPARVKFDAGVWVEMYDADMYGFDNPYIHIHIDSEEMKCGKYSHSIDSDNNLVVLDYDKNGGLIGIEVIIWDSELGDLKE